MKFFGGFLMLKSFPTLWIESCPCKSSAIIATFWQAQGWFLFTVTIQRSVHRGFGLTLEFSIFSACSFALSCWSHLFGFGLLFSNPVACSRKMWLINTELFNDEFYLNGKRLIKKELLGKGRLFLPPPFSSWWRLFLGIMHQHFGLKMHVSN